MHTYIVEIREPAGDREGDQHHVRKYKVDAMTPEMARQIALEKHEDHSRRGIVLSTELLVTS